MGYTGGKIGCQFDLEVVYVSGLYALGPSAKIISLKFLSLNSPLPDSLSQLTGKLGFPQKTLSLLPVALNLPLSWSLEPARVEWHALMCSCILVESY